MSESFTFDENTHTYRVDGVIVPGHTRVLDMGGLVPYAQIEPDILERKSQIGKEVHAATVLYDVGKKFAVDPQIDGYIGAWIDFREKTGFVPFLREYRSVYVLDGLRFCMQIDALGHFPGERAETVVEIKTTAIVMPHHGVQLAAQAACVMHGREMTSPLARFLMRKRIVVRLKPRGQWKVHPFTDRTDLDVFRWALGLTYWKMQHEKFYGEINHDDDDAVTC